MKLSLADRYEEGWLGSPAVADLDGDGSQEIVAPRCGKLVVWTAAGEVKWTFPTEGRIWSSPVVADFRGDAQLEVAIAARGRIHLLDAAGQELSGFPVTWNDELRGLAASDVDGDGQLDLVAPTTQGGPGDVVNAWRASGALLPGFPPLASGTSGCEVDQRCYFAGAFDQNVALGDLDGQGGADVVVPHDNAYASTFHGTGVAFDAASLFPSAKSPGVRYLHVLEEARQGYADDEDTALQAHFTNTAPAIADVDGDGRHDVILLASVQNAAQTDRLKGVALWVVRPDGSRLPGFDPPVHFPDYQVGLWDLGDNIVGATNQVTVADLDPQQPGPELIFGGFDGRIHAVSAGGTPLWAHHYGSRDDVLTAGVAVADLSADGVPEIVFATYSTQAGQGRLVILDAGGNPRHALELPGRGAMAVPTIADIDGDGTLEIVVSLKDAQDRVESVRVYSVPGSAPNCLTWPTGRGNLRRDGSVLSAEDKEGALSVED
jgi:hypothetical protein